MITTKATSVGWGCCRDDGVFLGPEQDLVEPGERDIDRRRPVRDVRALEQRQVVALRGGEEPQPYVSKPRVLTEEREQRGMQRAYVGGVED